MRHENHVLQGRILQVAIPRKGRTLCGYRYRFLIRTHRVLLQYRERAEPFAAITHSYDAYILRELQYRERAEPFAAHVCHTHWDEDERGCNTAKGQNPLRPRSARVVRSEFKGCNTAKGQNPLRPAVWRLCGNLLY